MPEDGAAGNWSDLSPIAYTQRDVLLCECIAEAEAASPAPLGGRLLARTPGRNRTPAGASSRTPGAALLRRA